MPPAFQGALGDQLSPLPVMGFDGGLNTVTNPLELKSGESPFIQNIVLTETGRMLGRNGSSTLSNTPGQNDCLVDFFNSDGNRCQVLWSNGDIYDSTSGTPVLLNAAVYTSSATTQIGRFVLDGILYWSDGVVYRYYDPTVPIEADVTLAVGAGLLTQVSFTCATVYTGFAVIGNCTLNTVYQGSSMNWCLLNDPTSWPGTNSQAVGLGFGGHIAALSSMGVADAGVPPGKSIIVLKSEEGVFLYSGALGSLSEAILPIPGGILDPESLEIIERSGRSTEDGTVRTYPTWLSTDRQIWWTDGINCGRYSDNIRNNLQASILTALTANPNQRFTAVNSTLDRQYLIDMGNGTQFVFQYDLGVWTYYQGLPSGLWSSGYGVNGLPAVFCAARTLNSLVQCLIPGQLTDDTNIIQMYYYSPYLHMNQQDVWKWAYFLYCTFITDNGQVEASVIPNFGQNIPGAQYTFEPTAVEELFELDHSLLDGPDVLAGPGQTSPYNVFEGKVQLMVPTAGYPPELEVRDICQGVNFQVVLAQTQKSGHFEILSYQLNWLPRGRQRGPKAA